MIAGCTGRRVSRYTHKVIQNILFLVLDDEQAPGQSENIADADLEDIVRCVCHGTLCL